MGGKELASTLVKMATSPVKADREAIARIERECQAEITQITVSLENSEIIAAAIETKPKMLKVLAMGMFWGAVIGTAALFIRPNYTNWGIGLGFMAGVSGSIVLKD